MPKPLYRYDAAQTKTLDGGLFAFVTSFDNYSISMWLSDAIYVPMPLTIFILIQRFFDPGIAAICTLMMLLSE